MNGNGGVEAAGAFLHTSNGPRPSSGPSPAVGSASSAEQHCSHNSGRREGYRPIRIEFEQELGRLVDKDSN